VDDRDALHRAKTVLRTGGRGHAPQQAGTADRGRPDSVPGGKCTPRGCRALDGDIVRNYSTLKRLAAILTNSRQDRLSFREQQVARSSRLITDDPHDTVTFSLLIFQQWFAAQAILDGTVSAQDVVADVASFNRWR